MESKKKENLVENVVETEQKIEEKVKIIPDIQELPITTASEWRKANMNVRKLLLPSGAVFLVKNVNFSFMISKGIIPLPILMSMAKLKTKMASKSTDKIMSLLNEEEFKNIDKMITAVTLEAVIEPRISEVDEENTIPIDAFDFIDKMFIFQECVKGGQSDYSEFFRQI